MPLLAKTEADRKRLLLRELCERFGRHLHPRASGRTSTSIAQELGVGEGTVRRAAAAKNLLQIAPASALVPVLEPGHFDPPQTLFLAKPKFSGAGTMMNVQCANRTRTERNLVAFWAVLLFKGS